MRVCIIIDEGRVCRWNLWVLEDLRSAGHEVVIQSSGLRSRWPVWLDTILSADRLLHHLSGPHALERISPDEHPRSSYTSERFDVAIHYSASAESSVQADYVFKPQFNGEALEIGTLSAFIDRRPIEIEIVNLRNRERLGVAIPAVPNRSSITQATDAVLSRMVELLVNVVGRVENGAYWSSVASDLKGSTVPAASAQQKDVRLHALSQCNGILLNKVKRKLSHKSKSNNRWAVALRLHNGSHLIEDLTPKRVDFRIVPDDGERFYADPMLVEHGGRTWLFCEEFPFDTKIGKISVAEVTKECGIGPMRPVLECDYHLSYPFVFLHDGRYWMIPETADNKTVDLYLATDFPYVWEFQRHLIEDAAIYDATPLQCDDHWLLLATRSYRNSTTWDQFCIFQADSLHSPFKPLPSGTAVIDARSARSAGAILKVGNKLLRPTQNCTEMYGGSICITQFDQVSRTQSEVASIRVCRSAGLHGTHTYTRSGSFEAVDVWGAVDDVQWASLELRPSDGVG